MTNSRASKGNLVLLDNHLATGTEATYTYTPASALDLKTKYREIQIIISGRATAALALEIKTNAATNYDISQIQADTSTLSTALAIDLTVVTFLTNNILDAADDFYAKIILVCNDANDMIMGMSQACAPHEGNFFQHWTDETTATTITSIEIKTSTSTWIAGTEISTYGLLR